MTNEITHSSTGTELVRKLSQEGEKIFTMKRAGELASSVGISLNYLPQALHHLARSGWIVRIKKGLYALSGAAPGVSPLHEFEVAMALVQPAAISHWSALSYHGLTEQSPQRVFVLTPSRSVPRVWKKKGPAINGYTVGKIVYQFIQIVPKRYFGVEEVWLHETKVKITDPERTLLDGLMAPQYCGDFSEVFHAFQVRAPKLDLDRIIGYALKLDTATAKRLGWILEQQGTELSKLDRLRSIPVKGYRILDPSGSRRGPCHSKWMIQVNLPGKISV